MSSMTAAVATALVDYSEVLSNIESISDLHTRLMAEAPWSEEWSNDPTGNDPRSFSQAMFRKLIEQGADFIFAKCNGMIAGVGVGMVLTAEYLNSMEWGLANCYSPRRPLPGDYEMNMVLVEPCQREQGIMRLLAESRLEIARKKLPKGKRIWVQTRPAEDETCCTSRVLRFYESRGFVESGFLEIKGTSRVFLTSEV